MSFRARDDAFDTSSPVAHLLAYRDSMLVRKQSRRLQLFAGSRSQESPRVHGYYIRIRDIEGQ